MWLIACLNLNKEEVSGLLYTILCQINELTYEKENQSTQGGGGILRGNVQYVHLYHLTDK